MLVLDKACVLFVEGCFHLRFLVWCGSSGCLLLSGLWLLCLRWLWVWWSCGVRVTGPFIIKKCVSPRCFYSERMRARLLVHGVAGNEGITLVSAHEVKGAKLVQRYFCRGRMGRRCGAFFVSVCTASDLHRFMFTLKGRVFRGLGPGKEEFVSGFFSIVSSLHTKFGLSDIAKRPIFSVNLKSVRTTRAALRRVFACLRRTSGPYVMTVSRFRRVNACTREGIRTMLEAGIRRYQGSFFVFTKDRERVVVGVFGDPTQPFCRDMDVVRLSTVPLITCGPFMGNLFARGKGCVASRLIRRICSFFRKRA